MSEADLRSIVSSILSGKLASAGYSEALVTIEKDFDGEDVIRVTARLDRPVADSGTLFEAASDIRQELIAQGDDRFVFVRQDYPQREGETLDEDAEGQRLQ